MTNSSSTWRKVRIAQLGHVVTGRTPPQNDHKYYGDAIPFLTPSDMQEQRRVDRPARFLSPFGAEKLARCLVPRGVGVSCIGWQMGKAIQIDRPTITNQQINSVVVDEAVADVSFVYYTLRMRRGELFNLGAGGSRTPILNKSDFEALPFLLPQLDEQRTIARILGTLDDKIELNRRMNETLVAIARAIFKSWFVDFDGQSDCVQSELGPLPRGWRIGSIADVADNIRDGVDPASMADDTPYVGLEHVPQRAGWLDSWGRAAEVESGKTRFRSGEILFGKLRPYFHKVVLAPIDGVCSTDILVIRPHSESLSGFVFGHLFSDAMVSHATALSDGTRMPRTSWASLCRFKVAIPPVERNRAFQEKCRPLLDRVAANAFESRTLAAIRDILLPKLLSGEIRVIDAEGIAQVQTGKESKT